MSKVYRSLQNFKDRLSASLTIKKRNILFFAALFLVFILAILIRLSPIIHDTQLIKAFDPWIQYYNAEYLSTHSIYEYFTWVDPKSWNYTGGIKRSILRPGLTFTSVAFYKILTFLGFPVTLYDVCYFFPAFMGGLTVLAMYFLGKEVLDRRVGLFAAFFLALSPGYMQRTVAGFFDNETIGVFAILMTFLFFLKTIRTGRVTYSILGGIFSGYLGLSWGGAQYVFFIIPLATVVLILLNKYNQNVLIAYAGIQGTGLLISSLYVNFKFDDLFSSLDVGGILLFSGLLIIYHIIHSQRTEHPKLYNRIMSFLKWGVIPAGIVLAVIIYTVPDIIPFGFGDRFQSILNPLIRNEIAFVASVAEHMPSSWSIFYYNILIPMMLLPLGIYFCFKRYIAADIFMIVFLLSIFYFTSSMIRIILVFAPAAALVGSYGLVNVLKIFSSFYEEKKLDIRRRRKKLLRRRKTIGKKEIYAIYLLVGFLCVSQVVHATDLSTSQLSYSQLTPGGVLHDWEQSLAWMKTNLPGDTVVVSWWDYGYWLTPIGNVTTVNDNGNYNVWVDGLTGISLMQTNEIYSAEILRELGADYVLVYFGFFYDGLGGDEGKWQWMLRIPNNHYERYINKGFEQDNWAENAVFLESEYINSSSGKYEEKWFQSQLFKLMTWGLFTSDPSGQFQEGSLIKHYIDQISNNRDDEGTRWAAHIPENGNWESDVFEPVYFSDSGFPSSRNGLVKLFEVDYTALESSFEIKEPHLFNTGYGTFKIENSGTKDIEIKNVSINDVPVKDFETGSSESLKEGEEDIIWFETEENFEVGETVKIEVDAVGGGTYEFSNSTSNLFVEPEEAGAVRIDREHSHLMYDESLDTSEIYLKIDNIGESPVLLKQFNVDSFEINSSEVEFLSGSAILEPGQSSSIHLTSSNISFADSIEDIIPIGVQTRNGMQDSTIFTVNRKIGNDEYRLVFLPHEREVSPELSSQLNSSIRTHIIPNNQTCAYLNEDGSITIDLEIGNIGNDGFFLNTIQILEGNYSNYNLLTEAEYEWAPKGEYIQPNEEKNIQINISDGNFNLNDDIGIKAIGTYGDIVSSDVGFLQVMNRTSDILILDNIHSFDTTSVNNNSEGQVLIKNVGTEDLNIDLNSNDFISFSNESLTVENISLTYGSSNLDIQDVALITFDIGGVLTVGQQLEIIVKTEEGVFDSYIITVISDDM